MYLEDHLEKLRYFYEVAKNGSIKRASANIHLTQPTLTKAIQVLEDSLDKKLFDRLPRGVSLTTEGEILYKFCHTLFASIEEIEKKIKSPKDPFAGSLRVGTYDSIVSYFWPDFLKNFLKEMKNKIEELNVDDFVNKYDIKNYVFTLLNHQNNQLSVYIKTNFNNNKNSKNIFYDINNIKDQLALNFILRDLKLKITDLWKEENLINLLMPLSINLKFKHSKLEDLDKLRNTFYKINIIDNYTLEEFNINNSF